MAETRQPSITTSLNTQEDHVSNTADSTSEAVEAKTPNGTETEIREVFRCSKTFARKKYWSQFFPKIVYDELKERRRRNLWLSRRSRALLLNVGLVGTILLVNFGLTVFAAAHFRGPHGVGIIYQGSCATVQQLDTYIHLLINLLGTGMLMASNYCMQLQAAPTRENVDEAHKAGKWLDIGVPSLRNFRWISRSRQLCWLLLAMSSVPVHFIYNSAVFQSLASNDYTIAVVNHEFVNGGRWSILDAKARASIPAKDLGEATNWVADNQPGYVLSKGWQIPGLTPENTIREMQQNASSGLYLRQSVSECYAGYADYWASLGNLVVVTKNQSVQAQVNDSLLIFASVIPRHDNWAKNSWARDYAYQGPNTGITVNNWYLGSGKYEVDYCLVQRPVTTEERCRFEYSAEIMITVCVINLIKLVVMFVTWFMRLYQSEKQTDLQREVLYTLGDAISSFIRKEDDTTKNMCLATKDDFVTTRTLKDRFVRKLPNPSQEPKVWECRPAPWWKAASALRWLILIVTWVLVLLTASVLLATGFEPLRRRGIETSMSSFWDLGFGKLTPFTYIVIPGFPHGDPGGLIANVLLANLPQFLLSILYLLYNAMMSCFLVQLEFSKMWNVRKTLRVSEPQGIQRSSYFISLPLRYGIPLYTTAGIMHWLISQSLFLARITAFFPDGIVDEESSFSTCGYSPIATIITILMGGLLVLGMIVLGFRHYDGTMPLVSTNSRAISAACHPPDPDKPAGYLMPVIWGVTEINDEGIAHCTVTTAADIKTVKEAPTFGATSFR